MKLLIVLTLFLTYFPTFSAMAYFQNMGLTAADGTVIRFTFEINYLEDNQREMNLTSVKNLRVTILGGTTQNPNSTAHPGSVIIFWYKNCNFSRHHDGQEFYQKTYKLNWYPTPGGGPLLETELDDSTQTIKMTSPNGEYFCNWTQEAEFIVNGKKFIDPVSNSHRFQFNFND